jgi:hypothetical protein
VHWIKNGKLQSMILNFIKYVIYVSAAIQLLTTVSRATKGHTGAYLAGRISECLHDFGIQRKVAIILLICGTY